MDIQFTRTLCYALIWEFLWRDFTLCHIRTCTTIGGQDSAMAMQNTSVPMPKTKQVNTMWKPNHLGSWLAYWRLSWWWRKRDFQGRGRVCWYLLVILLRTLWNCNESKSALDFHGPLVHFILLLRLGQSQFIRWKEARSWADVLDRGTKETPATISARRNHEQPWANTANVEGSIKARYKWKPLRT